MTQQVSNTNNNSNWPVNPKEDSTPSSGATKDLAKRCEAAVANIPIGNSGGIVTVTARAGNDTDSTLPLQVKGFVEAGGRRVNYSSESEKPENPAELEEAEAAIERHLRALLASPQSITITHQVSGGTHVKAISTSVSAAPTKSSERRKD